MQAWAEKGVLTRVWDVLERRRERQGDVNCDVLSLDSTCIPVHPNGTGARRHHGPQCLGKSAGGWPAKLHLMAADARTAVAFTWSAGNGHDAPEGRRLRRDFARPADAKHLRMDGAYEGDATRALAEALGYVPVVPPRAKRKQPWVLDRTLDKRRNEVERLFRRLKAFRRVAFRFDKLDKVFCATIAFALIVDTMRHLV